MLRALVTGHKGFIGSNLVTYLEKSDFEVAEFDLGDFGMISSLFLRSQVEEVLSISDPDVIFHVGANSNTLDTDANRMFLANYEVSKWIADWAGKYERPIIYSSSAANYGTNGLYPSNLYGWSKYAAEDYIRKCGGVSLRYFNVYGPGENHKLRMASFVNQVFFSPGGVESALLFPGEPKRDFVHVDDVCSANLFAFKSIEKPEVRGGVFEVGTGEAHTFEEALSLFGAKWRYFLSEEVPVGYQMFTQARFERFLPGWRPEVDFESGMRSYLLYLERAETQ
jgi:ADP-L-glycero-D-manno-heptose 6-epimerase